MSTNRPNVGLQLYSLREASQENFDEVLERVASLGIRGVEPFHLFGKSPSAFKQQVEDLGMQICSSHYPWLNRAEDPGRAADKLQALGLTRAPGGFMPDDFADGDALARTIEKTQQMVEQLKTYGMTLFLHNHYWEFALVDDQVAYHTLQRAVPEVEFEIDTYWAANFGQRNPAEEVARVKQRMPLMHVKDGNLEKGAPNLPLGEGAIDIPALFAAAEPTVLQWAIIEFDACEGDLYQAIEQSHRFLTEQHLADAAERS